MTRGDEIGGKILTIDSILSGTPGSENYLRGLVRLSWADLEGQLTPDEADAHAMRIMAVAAGARQDEALVRFLMQRLGMPLEEAAAILVDFRAMRG